MSVKISQLPYAQSLNGNAVIPIVQNSVTMQTSIEQISTFLSPPVPTAELCQGNYPGTVYTTSQTPYGEQLIALYLNVMYVLPTNYSLSGNTITLNFSTAADDQLFAVYFAS